MYLLPRSDREGSRVYMFVKEKSREEDARARQGEAKRWERRWTTRSGHLDHRGTSSAPLGQRLEKWSAGRFPGHAFVETLEHQVSLPLLLDSFDMLRGCACPERDSPLRKRVPARPLGHEARSGTTKCSQSRPATALPATKRYPRIVQLPLRPTSLE